MESVQKVKMIIDLEKYFEPNKGIKIYSESGNVIEGLLLDYEKGFVAEQFYDPQTGDAIDPPEMIVKLKIQLKSEDQILEIPFREILKFEPI